MQVVLIQFKEAGKKYYFSYTDTDIKQGDAVVVETTRGLEIGRVYAFRDVENSEVTGALKPVIRIAEVEDIETDTYNQSLEPGIVDKTKNLAKKNGLEIKVLGAEYTLDRKRLVIYFESETRVDFRLLVKDLSEVYHTRIELRQIGPRDAAKMIGGVGPCGLMLCCSTFIGEFDTVSIKMAKNQNISLNPQKISGVCGKLLCCIRYEEALYAEFKKRMPDLNETVQTERGNAKIIEVNILMLKAKVRYPDNGVMEWLALSDMTRESKDAE